MLPEAATKKPSVSMRRHTSKTVSEQKAARAINGSLTPDYNIRGQAGNQVGSNRGSLLRFERKEKRRKVLVYELGWPDEKDGRAVFRKERYYLDEETGQPRKIEKYFRYEPDGEYVLEGTRIIGESTDEEEAEETD